jgi:hypothetical protein
MVGGCVIASKPRLPFAGSVVVLNRRARERSSASSVFAPAIALPSKLRVAPAETEHMPIYIRTFSFEYCPVVCTKLPAGVNHAEPSSGAQHSIRAPI